MATSSQYHRGATTPSSHYHSLPSSHGDLYTNLATTWSASHGFSRPQPPHASGLLQRFTASSPPVQQRPFAGTGYYQEYGPSTDYVNHHQPSQQHQQPASQTQPHPGQSQSHGQSSWPGSAAAGGWTETPLSYASLDGRAPPETQQQQQQQQHQDPSDSTHSVLLPGHGYRSPGHHPHRDQLTSELSAAPAAPPYLPQLLHNSAPVARLLNYSDSDLHVTSPQALSQAPLPWSAATSSVVPPTSAHQHPNHTGAALSSNAVLANPDNLESSPWSMLSSVETSNQTSSVYEHMPAIESAWSQVDAQPAHMEYLQQPHPISHHPSNSHSGHHEVATPRGRRTHKPVPRKSVPKVPAAFVERQEKVKVSKRKGPLTEESRLKTHQMRKDKTTCLRCRFYKSGCDAGEPCQKCLKTEGNARSFKLPCIRERLEDATLVRHCNGRSNQEEGEFLTYDWATGCQLYDMEIIWNLPGYGPITTSQPMRITFRQYHPQRPFLDTTNMWSNTEGQVKVVEQPPYAVYDTASLSPIFERYFSHLQPAIEQWIFDRVQHDEIALLTYREVQRLRRCPDINTHLLDLVMRIQCLSVVSQGYGTVWSNNIPGIQTVDFGELGRSEYEAYDRSGRDRPLPGAINHQMDVAALKYLKKLERQCVKELSTMMFKSKIKPWYELFLALYVLFWNMEYIHRGANKYIMSKNGTAIQTQVSSVVRTQIKKWDWAFQVLKHHWIAVLRGYMPFKLARENPDELREKGHLDLEGFQYVMRVAQIFDQIGFGQSTAPFVGYPSTHNSMSSHWIKILFTEAGA